MDTLYIGDIPSEYHYALFNNGYIDLYNTDTLNNGSYDFYRLYTNCGGFYYRHLTTTYGQYNNTIAENITTTDNICYRSDYINILSITLIFILIGMWLLNLFTSIIRKGGILGGLF